MHKGCEISWVALVRVPHLYQAIHLPWVQYALRPSRLVYFLTDASSRKRTVQWQAVIVVYTAVKVNWMR